MHTFSVAGLSALSSSLFYMVGSPIAAGKRLGKEINNYWNIIQSEHHFKKPETESTGLLGFFFLLFKPKVLRMLSGLARKTSLLHVSVLELF